MATQEQLTQPAPDGHDDFMPLHGIDHVELWVGNALHATYFLTHSYGFREVAYQGLETGVRDHVSRGALTTTPSGGRGSRYGSSA